MRGIHDARIVPAAQVKSVTSDWIPIQLHMFCAGSVTSLARDAELRRGRVGAKRIAEPRRDGRRELPFAMRRVTVDADAVPPSGLGSCAIRRRVHERRLSWNPSSLGDEKHRRKLSQDPATICPVPVHLLLM